MGDKDSETTLAVAHAEKVNLIQEKEAFPVQVLRGRKLPSDAKVAKVEWEAVPAGLGDSWVDVYEGPQGIGYVVTYEIDKGGVLFYKAINKGPETYREQDWTEVRENVGNF